MNKSILVLCFVAGIAAMASAEFVPAAFIPPAKVTKGSSISGQIIAGKIGTSEQFPWQAGLLITVGTSQYICGGTLVHPQWVLTAAHCVNGATKVIVRLGSPNHSSGGTTYTVTGTANIIKHANYNTQSLANDVGLIKLTSAVKNSTTIKPINILPTTVTSFTGNLTVSGFGRTCDAQTTTCDAGKVLNYVNVVPMVNKDCENVFGKVVVTNNTICTKGYNGGKESTCGGDSGGPLVQLNTNAKNYLVGVVSFGAAAGCELKHPAGFMRANKFCDWMKTKAGVTICV